MTRATRTIAITFLCGTAAAVPLVPFESPCDNHGKHRWAEKNGPVLTTYGREIVPCHGREKVPVLRLICPPRSKVPVALANRPVPLVIKAISVLSNKPGTSVC